MNWIRIIKFLTTIDYLTIKYTIYYGFVSYFSIYNCLKYYVMIQ